MSRDIKTFVLDLSEDLILSSADIFDRVYKYREQNLITPTAIWLNLNQSYVLACEFSRSTDSDADPKETAPQLDQFAGMKVFIKGRDIVCTISPSPESREPAQGREG